MINYAKDILISQAQVVGPEHVYQADVLVLEGKIAQIGALINAPSGIQTISASGKYLLPGFIDIHNHGAGGFDFTFGQYAAETDQFMHNEETFKAGLQNYLQHNLRTGTVLLYPTTMAAPVEIIKNSLGWLKDWINLEEGMAAMIGGVNLEGTFLKDPAFAGAQNPRFFYPPTAEILADLQTSSGQLLKIVNLPPEHGAEGLKFIQELNTQQVVVAGGHSAAYGDEYLAAVDAGLSLAVHFLNGPSRRSSKGFRQGGAEEAMLGADRVYLELICDGYHVHPAYVRDVIARKGAERVIIITDSMFANGMPGLKHFSLFGLGGAVSAQGDYLQLRGSEDTLFGSVLNMQAAYQNMLNWLTVARPGVWHRYHDGYSLNEALTLSSRMASANPAQLLGQADNFGSIEVGKQGALLLAQITCRENIHFQLDQILFPQ